MRYPYAVVVKDANGSHLHVVEAADIHESRTIALAQHKRKNGNDGVTVRAVNLTPRELDGTFIPRVDGRVIGEPCAAYPLAVKESLEILRGRRRAA